jgi:NO-binding membrane sensor protein with MHYT domain
LLVAVVGAVGLALATHEAARHRGRGAIIGRRRLIHFVGMEALALPGAMQWDQARGRSILIGVVLSAASLLTELTAAGRRGQSALLVVAIAVCTHGHGSGGALPPIPRWRAGSTSTMQHWQSRSRPQHRGDAGRAGGNADLSQAERTVL